MPIIKREKDLGVQKASAKISSQMESLLSKAQCSVDVQKIQDYLIAGWTFEFINKLLIKNSKYVVLSNKNTSNDIKEVQKNIEEGDFRLSPTLHDSHWCCSIITKNKIYVFDSTLQTQENKNSEIGTLMIGDSREENVIYLNHGEPIQNYEVGSAICGPCVVKFINKVERMSIEEILNNKLEIFKYIAQSIYDKLENKSSANLQFTKKYYNLINKVSQQQDINKTLYQQINTEDNGTETGFGHTSKNTKNKSTYNALFFQDSFSKISSVEDVEELKIATRSHSAPSSIKQKNKERNF